MSGMSESRDPAARLDEVRDDVAALATQIRRVIAAAVSLDAPRDVITAATRAVAAIADGLEPHVPKPHPPRYPGGHAAARDAADFFPFDPVIGRLSPLAPPVVIEWHDPKAIGLVRFGVPYEGPPGCVHGAILAATFDQVFNVANLMRGVAGPTRRLEIRYRKPTPLLADLRFEGWVDRVEGREVHTRGRVLHGDVVTVEAEGTFVQISHERVMRLLDTAAGPQSPDAAPAAAAGPQSPDEAPAPADAPPAKESAAARKRRFRRTGDAS